MSREMQALYVQQFASEAKIALSETVGGKLKSRCQVETIDHGESYTFANREGFSVGKVAPNLYQEADVAGTNGNTGDDASYTVTPEAIYGSDRVKNSKLNKSMIKATSNFMKGLTNALDIACDVEVIKAIEAEDASLIKVGSAATDITDDANILAFKQAAFLAVANTSGNNALTGGAPVGCIMNTKDYAYLLPKGGTEGNMLSSSDFKILQNANGVLSTNLFGTEIITYKDFKTPSQWGGRKAVIESGDTLFMPDGTVGYVEWKKSDRAESKYMPLAGDRSVFWVSRSVGCKALEPEAIIKFSSKPIV